MRPRINRALTEAEVRWILWPAVYGEAVDPANFAGLDDVDWGAMWRVAIRS